MVGDVFCWFGDDILFLREIFPRKLKKYTYKASFLRNEWIFFIRVCFYTLIYASIVLEKYLELL